MGYTQGHIGAQGWSKGLISFGVNEPRIRKNNNKLVVAPEEPSFLGKALWKVGARLPREYCARGNHSLEDKL